MMTTLFLEAALRSLMMAAAVWGSLRLLRVTNVFAQKIAWTLVLIASTAMPFLGRWQGASNHRVVTVPVTYLNAPAATQVPIARETVSPQVGQPRALTLAPDDVAPKVQLTPSRVQTQPWHRSSLASLVVPAYLSVASILLLRVGCGVLLAWRIWHRARATSGILEPGTSVRVSSLLGSPVTIGSSIILPRCYPDWKPCKLRIVLAHERSHVRQGDFYLQLAASLYTAIFWISPLGWWLQHKLAELGEAISDRAALEEAENRSSYAELLLEFAALPHRTVAGVAMARSSNIQRRIDRLLTEGQFLSAFKAFRRHALVALAVVPLALLLSTSLVGVQAAEVAAAKATHKIVEPMMPQPLAQPAPVPAIAPLPPASAISAPVHAALAIVPAKALRAAAIVQATPAVPPTGPVSAGESNAYAIVDADSSIQGSFRLDSDFAKAREKFHGNYIFFERNGKAYVIDDPALFAQSREMFEPLTILTKEQAELSAQDAVIVSQNARLLSAEPKIKIEMPNIQVDLSQIQEQLKNLDTKGMRQMDLSRLQSSMKEPQGKLSVLQKIRPDQQALLAEMDGKVAQANADLSKHAAELSILSQRLGGKASSRINALIDKAMREGKAKPVN